MPPALTRSAEGFDRRAFTVEEVLRMQAAGIIGEDENFELVDGEIVPMGPKFAAHELIKSELGTALAQHRPANLRIGFETTLFLSPRTFVEPDLCLYPRNLASEQVRGEDVVLAVEVAVSSLAYDRGLKALLYARHGVRDLWVIDAKKRVAWLHRGPSQAGWAEISRRGPRDELRHEAVPGFAMKLGEI